MQYIFAAVATWFLLFTEPVKGFLEEPVTALIKGSNSSLETIYNLWSQEVGFLDGALSRSNSPQQEGFLTADETSTTSDMLFLAWDGDFLLVEVTATTEGAETLLAPTFETFGFRVTGCTDYMCSGYLDMATFPAFSADEKVKTIRPSIRTALQAGSKVSEAIKALRVDLVRAANPTLTGAGLKIGILSISFDTLNGYAADVATNDLPNNVTVLKEYSIIGNDEGRAMAQLIHDLVPGAQLFVRTAAEGASDFARGIQELADAGCDVIVDDITYNLEPFFQEGVIAQSANDVAELRGVPFFSAAGNDAKQSWEGTFQGSGILDANNCEIHAFAVNNTRQSVDIIVGARITFQWEDPFFSVSGGSGASRNMDFRIYFNGALLVEDVSDNTGIDPVAFLGVQGTGTYEFEFSLCTTSTSPPLMKWIAVGDIQNAVRNVEFDTKSSTLFGHHNAAFAAGVGAAFYRDTPAFGRDPPKLQTYSSRGGCPILFDRSGTRLAANEVQVRMQPRFVAPDGIFNTFFGAQAASFPNGLGWYFYGTSAAAPNAASVAILMLQKNPNLTPIEIYTILEDTAINMNEVGFDYDSGYGLIDALGAVAATPTPCVTVDGKAGVARSLDDVLSASGVALGNLTDYLFFFAKANGDANWQSASKGYLGDVAIDGIEAREKTSGTFAYSGTIHTSDSTLGTWQGIVDKNAAQAFRSLGSTSLISALELSFSNAVTQINALNPTAGYESMKFASLDGKNTTNGVSDITVINMIDGGGKIQVEIFGDSSDVFILRWDVDKNPANGYSNVFFQSGGGIVPKGGLTPANFIHVAAAIGASGGGSNPPSPYPQGPYLSNGTLIAGGANFAGGGFYTGYWLTTGDSATYDPILKTWFGKNTLGLSNAIFVGGWYSVNTKFSMTGGTSGVHIEPKLCVQ